MAAPEVQDAAAALDAQEQQRQQERERALQQQNAPQADARLSRPVAVLPDYPVNESPCFTINRLTLVGESAARFQWALDAAADAKGRCLGSQGIVLIINKVQN
ncbi:ShlB/FhaC/HecB family hemolysin secretion/activation protein, partial [Serratia sp. IR-2025]